MIRAAFIVFLLTTFVASAQVEGPKVSAQQLAYNFGDVNQGDIVSHSFVLSNNGGDLLSILDVKASCGCTAANPDKNSLKPGETTNIVVSFNSKGRKGVQNKTVAVKTNDKENPTLTFTIKCNVIVPEKAANKDGALILFPENQFDFGQVSEGQIVEHTFKFSNSGNAVLNIKDIKTSCGCTAAMVSEKVIKPGESGSIKVELDTKSRAGKMSRTVTVVSNDQNNPNKVITIFADVIKK
jgi:hypothetical protein